MTLQFKLMLQRGIDMADLDVSYVSALSWFFLNLFGLQGIHAIIMGDAAAQAGEMDMMYATNPALAFAASAGGAIDIKQQFQSERDELELIQLQQVGGLLKGAEQRLMAAHP
jgi:ER membrane protein complex subunit 3